MGLVVEAPFGLGVVAAGMGCFDCVGSSFGRSYFAQHDVALRSRLAFVRLDSPSAALKVRQALEGWAGESHVSQKTRDMGHPLGSPGSKSPPLRQAQGKRCLSEKRGDKGGAPGECGEGLGQPPSVILPTRHLG